MSDYAELKARLYRWELVWGYLPSIAPHPATVPGMTTGVVIMDTQDAAAAIDALEREVEQLVAERNDTIKQLERFAKRHQDHLVMGAQVRQRAEAAEARAKQLEAALLWCSGSDDFNEGGVARKGWLKVCAPLLAALQEDKSHE